MGRECKRPAGRRGALHSTRAEKMCRENTMGKQGETNEIKKRTIIDAG